MDAYKCDNCKKYVTGEWKDHNNIWPVESIHKNHFNMTATFTKYSSVQGYIHADICPGCMNDLIEQGNRRSKKVPPCPEESPPTIKDQDILFMLDQLYKMIADAPTEAFITIDLIKERLKM
jgi:hypothetical protein